MSIRLNVVVSQSSGNAPAAQEVESQLAMRLMGTAGVNLTLVGPLERISHNSTDRLALEGLAEDLAVLCWHPPASAAELLAAAGVSGRRGKHSLDLDVPETSAPAARRLYLVDMRGKSPDQLTSALEQLLAARRTVTFSLSPPRARRHGHAAPQSSAAPAASASPIHGAWRESSIGPTAARHPAETAEPADEPIQPRMDDPWEALVDDLNASDI